MSRLRIESPLTTEQEDLIYRVIGVAIEVHQRALRFFVVEPLENSNGLRKIF
jgi:hypothetical protein